MSSCTCKPSSRMRGRSRFDERAAQHCRYLGQEEAMSLLPLDDECRGSLLRGLRLRLYRNTASAPVPGAAERPHHCSGNRIGRGGDGVVSSHVSIISHSTRSPRTTNPGGDGPVDLIAFSITSLIGPAPVLRNSSVRAIERLIPLGEGHLKLSR